MPNAERTKRVLNLFVTQRKSFGLCWHSSGRICLASVQPSDIQLLSCSDVTCWRLASEVRLHYFAIALHYFAMSASLCSVCLHPSASQTLNSSVNKSALFGTSRRCTRCFPGDSIELQWSISIAAVTAVDHVDSKSTDRWRRCKTLRTFSKCFV